MPKSSSASQMCSWRLRPAWATKITWSTPTCSYAEEGPHLVGRAHRAGRADPVLLDGGAEVLDRSGRDRPVEAEERFSWNSAQMSVRPGWWSPKA